MTPNPIDDEDSGNRRTFRRRSSDQPAPAKTFGLAIAVIGLVGSIFTAGYNWRSVSIVEGKQETFEKDYVRKDVQQYQLENMNNRLYEISKQLEELRGELRSQRRKE